VGVARLRVRDLLMGPLTSLDRRLPAYAVGVVAAACTAVLASGGAVVAARAGAPGRVSSLGPAGQSASPSATPSPTASPKPKKAVTVADFLAPYDTLVPGFERVSDKLSGGGPIDLAKAAAIESGDRTPSARDKKLIGDAGFVRGYSRVWDDGDVTVVVYVYEWRTPLAARTFVRGAKLVHERRHDAWATGVPYAAGSCRRRDGDIVDGEVLSAGHHTFIVAVIRDGSCSTHTQIARLAKVQYQHAVALHA
jgi:hypothetical protein